MDWEILEWGKRKDVGQETSPPSARVAAMSDMQHKTSLKHRAHFLETPLKRS